MMSDWLPYILAFALGLFLVSRGLSLLRRIPLHGSLTTCACGYDLRGTPMVMPCPECGQRDRGSATVRTRTAIEHVTLGVAVAITVFVACIAARGREPFFSVLLVLVASSPMLWAVRGTDSRLGPWTYMALAGSAMLPWFVSTIEFAMTVMDPAMSRSTGKGYAMNIAMTMLFAAPATGILFAIVCWLVEDRYGVVPELD